MDKSRENPRFLLSFNIHVPLRILDGGVIMISYLLQVSMFKRNFSIDLSLLILLTDNTHTMKTYSNSNNNKTTNTTFNEYIF